MVVRTRYQVIRKTYFVLGIEKMLAGYRMLHSGSLPIPGWDAFN